MSKNVLLLGPGDREHGLAWKLSQDKQIKNIYAIPGSHAIKTVDKVTCVNISIKDHAAIAKFYKENNIDLAINGPTDPLVDGIADYLTKEGCKIFAPTRNAARIEWDKNWAKAFFDRHGIPTARWKSFTDVKEAHDFINNTPFKAWVVKANGLAIGKGVTVANSKEEACRAATDLLVNKKWEGACDSIIVEEILEGPEVSVFAFTDGTSVVAMPPAQDHKRIFDNDLGPNTGGMGAYAPALVLNQKELDYVVKEIIQKTVDGLKKEGIKYVGVLYCGILVTKDGPVVLEYNARFGNPEVHVLLPLLKSSLFDVMLACVEGNLSDQKVEWIENLYAVVVFMACRGYPESISKGDIITGIDEADSLPGIHIFQGECAMKDGKIVTDGGKCIAIVCADADLEVAAAKATQCCQIIKFPGAQWRTDIAHKGIATLKCLKK